MFDKILIGFALVLIVLMGIGTAYYLKIVSDLENDLVTKDRIIQQVGNDLNVAYSLLYTCEENTTKEGLEGYIDGIGDHNETVNTTLDNLST